MWPSRVHQDIKPQNILLCRGESDLLYDFVPMIADFGNADIKFLDSDKMDLDRNYGLCIDRGGSQTYGKLYLAPTCTLPWAALTS
jgi:serine/threonine protein kinase